MELTQLRQFKSIAEYGTITRAAEQLHVSQPALSAMLHKLEDELGVRLFIRSHNRLSLSPAGEMALLHVNAILDRVSLMQEDLVRYQRKENTICVSFCDPGLMWYFSALYSRAYPHIELQPSTFDDNENSAKLLLNQTKDILVTSQPIRHPNIVCEPFLRDHYMLSISETSPLAKENELSFRTIDLSVLGCLHHFSPMPSATNQRFQKFWPQVIPDLQIKEYDDYILYIQKIRTSSVPTLSTYLVQRFRDDGSSRVLIPIVDPELAVQYYLCYMEKDKKHVSSVLNWKKYIL